METSDMSSGEMLRAQAERDNEVRYREPSQHARGARDGSSAGHVESHFLKANSPDGTRAVWLKHTLLVPLPGRGAPLAESWAVAFDQGGRRKRALKRSYSLEEGLFERAPFRSCLPDSELATERAVGDLGELAWALEVEARQPSFRPYPLEAMYTGAFPRSKSITPNPDARVRGWFQAFGERWQLSGWRGAQGHNWGASHAHAYAWVHTNALCHEQGAPPIEGAWLEALTGRVRVGGLLTPFLSVAGIHYGGRLVRFGGPRALLSRAVSVDTRSFRFELAAPGARLRAEFSAEGEQFVGLRYQDPDGSELACLNSKLAGGTLTLDDGDRHLVLHTHQAALEIGTRAPSHGVALLA
jgi:hypothetical protein